MSTINVANVNFESTANNQLLYFGSNSVQIRAGGANVAVVNSTNFTLAASILASGFGGIVNVQSFSANGTYTRSAGVTKALIFTTGGGGAGGSAGLLTGGAPGGAGGGGGATAIALINVASIATATVTIGPGGTAAGTGNNAGGAGGNTTFVNAATTFISANGGNGGATSNVALAQSAGGGGGVATFNSCLFSLSIPGGLGGRGVAGAVTTGRGGDGGSTFFGAGAVGALNYSTAAVITGATALLPGTGGAGGSANATTAVAGGAGATGFMLVLEIQ